jgi:hypothetical protein
MGIQELWLNTSDSTLFKSLNPDNCYLNEEDIGAERWNLTDTLTVQSESGGQMS